LVVVASQPVFVPGPADFQTRHPQGETRKNPATNAPPPFDAGLLAVIVSKP
jgi:hypothetical protein